jgi:hypothetical protein
MLPVKVAAMQSLLKWIIRICLLLLSVDAIIVVADWGSRWDWLEHMLAAHPALAAIFHGPMFPLLCLGVCILVVYGREYLKLPDIHVEAERIQFMAPDLGGIIPLSVADQINRTQDYELRIDTLVRIYISNASERPVVIRHFEGTLILRKGKRFEIPKKYGMSQSNNFVGYRTKKDTPVSRKGVTDIETIYSDEVRSLADVINNVQLANGIGYDGWIKMEAKNVKRKHFIDRTVSQIALRVVDTAGKKYRVSLKDKQSEDTEEVIPPFFG